MLPRTYQTAAILTSGMVWMGDQPGHRTIKWETTITVVTLDSAL